jgi:hypothetical protein
MSRSKLSEKVEQLGATLEKLDYQIKHHQQFYSREQILIWRRSRRDIFQKLEFYKKMLKHETELKAKREELNRLSRL